MQRVPEEKLERAFESARTWFLSSEIQADGVPRLRSGPRGERSRTHGVLGTAVHGGFWAWLDGKTGRPSYLYPEITGYGITALLFLDRLKSDPALVTRAQAAGDWVLDHAVSREGLLSTRLFPGPDETLSPDGPVSYLFDHGMVGAGLALLHRRTKERKYLEGSLTLWDTISRKLSRADGSFYAAFDSLEGIGWDNVDKWSTQAGAYHAKVALWLWGLFQETGRDLFRDEARRFCERALDAQGPDGRFVTNRADRSTHLHPHCYAAEGLLVLGQALGEGRFTDAAVRAADWALKLEQEDGQWTSFVNGEGVASACERSDVLAQILRLSLVLREVGLGSAAWEPSLGRLTHRLLSYQVQEMVHSSDERQATSDKRDGSGGFRYGQDLDGVDRLHLNAWCSMFALQALAVASDRGPGRGRWRDPAARLALEYWV